MNPDQSLKATDFMTNALGNTKITMSGKCLQIFLITSHLQQWLKVKFLVLMVVCLHHSLLLMTFVNLIDSNKYRTKVRFVIFCGVIQIKDSVLMSVPEEQAGLSAR